MYITITAGIYTWRVTDYTQSHGGYLYDGRLLNNITLQNKFAEAGTSAAKIDLQIRNDDRWITGELWGATVEVELPNGNTWLGKVKAYDHDGQGILYVSASDIGAPELDLMLPDEVAHVFDVSDMHTSYTDYCVPLAFGGTAASPLFVKGILINKSSYVYLLSVGEIRSVVKVYKGTEEITTGYTAYTGTSGQSVYPGFACIVFDADPRNDDGTWPDIYADVVGLKLGTATEAECRNPARILYYLLTTARTGVNGWGLGVSASDIDTASFTQAITDCDTYSFKIDGVITSKQQARYWVDQITRACRGNYYTYNGKRYLTISKPGSSLQTYDLSNMRIEREGKGDCSQRRNKVVIDYRHNAITGSFTANETREDTASINLINEQAFNGQLALVAEQATAGAIADYELRRYQYGEGRIYFATLTASQPGQVITVNRPDIGYTNALYQVTTLDTGDDEYLIDAQAYSDDIYDITTPGSAPGAITGDAPVSSAYAPAAASGLTLETHIETYLDGTTIAYIFGTFTLPAGAYLGAIVQWGIGSNPTSWVTLGTIKGNTFRLSPVANGETYTFRVITLNAAGQGPTISATIVASADTSTPAVPTVVAAAGLHCITLTIGLSPVHAAFSHYVIKRAKSDGSAETVIDSRFVKSSYTDSDPAIITDYITGYKYACKAVTRSGVESAYSSWTTAVMPITANTKDLAVGSITSDLITSDEIYGKIISTAQGAGNGTVSGVRMDSTGISGWNGATNNFCLSATNGYLTAQNANISGAITATSGSFTGTLHAGTGDIAGWCINTGCLYGGDIVLNSAGSIYTSTYASGLRGWSIGSTGNAEFNNIVVRGELRSSVFAYDEITAVGGQMLIAEAGLLAAEWTTPALNACNTLCVRNSPAGTGIVFAANDIIRAKTISSGGVSDAWAKVISATACTGYYLYCVQLMSGSASSTIPAGVAVANYGPATTSAGAILLNGQGNCSPYIDVFTNGATPWAGLTPRVRMGSLSGIAGMSGYGLWTDSGYIVGGVVQSTNWGKSAGSCFDLTGGCFALGGSSAYKLCWNGTTLGVTGNITITGGSGIANLSDVGALATVDNLDGVPDGTSYAKTTPNQVTGAGRAYYGLTTLGCAYGIVTGDTRSCNYAPCAYPRGTFNEFKYSSCIGISGADLYGNLETAKPWGDSSGGYSTQTYKDSTGVYRRRALNGATSWGTWYRETDGTGALVSRVIPLYAATPGTGTGLFLGCDYMGYYNGSAWKTYMDNTGKFYLTGASGGLAWDGSALTVCGTVCSTAGKIGGLTIGGNYLCATTGTGLFYVNVACGAVYTCSGCYLKGEAALGRMWWSGAYQNAYGLSVTAQGGCGLYAGIGTTIGTITLPDSTSMAAGCPFMWVGDSSAYMKYYGGALTVKGTICSTCGNIAGFLLCNNTFESLNTVGTCNYDCYFLRTPSSSCRSSVLSIGAKRCDATYTHWTYMRHIMCDSNFFYEAIARTYPNGGSEINQNTVSIITNASATGNCGVPIFSVYSTCACGIASIETGKSYALSVVAAGCYALCARAYNNALYGCASCCYGVYGFSTCFGVYGYATTGISVGGNTNYNTASSRALKMGFTDIDILPGLRQLCIQKWVWQDKNSRMHDEFVGPVAEDVQSVWGLRFENDNLYQLDGIALKAAQEIDRNVSVLETCINNQQACINDLASRLAAIESKLAA